MERRRAWTEGSVDLLRAAESKGGGDGVEKCRQTNVVSGRRVECVFSVANH